MLGSSIILGISLLERLVRARAARSAHLRWIVIWLSGALAVSNILIQVSNTANNYELLSLTVIWIIYLAILAGMSFSIYRLTNIVKIHMRWYLSLRAHAKDLPFNELYSDRGFLQKLFVDDEGNVLKYNMWFFIFLQDAFFIVLLGMISSPVKEFLIPVFSHKF